MSSHVTTEQFNAGIQRVTEQFQSDVKAGIRDAIEQSQAATQAAMHEILEVIHVFSDNMDRRFDGVEIRVMNVETRLTSVETRLTNVEEDLTHVKATVNSQMVTKDYLDEKLWDLQGAMVPTADRRVRKHEVEFHTV